MSESSAPNFVYSRRKLQGNTIDFLSTITERSGEDCPCVINSDGPSVPAKEHHVVSEEEHETEAVIESFMPPITCNRAEYSHPLSLGRHAQLTTASLESEGAAPNFVYGRRKPQQNYVNFSSARVPAMEKRSGEDCLSVISLNGPSFAHKEDHLVSQYEHGSALMPPPTIHNKDDSSCQLSLQRSPQPPTFSKMSEISASNFVYSRRKMRGNSVTFLFAQVPGIAKRSGQDCLSVVSSDGPSLAVEGACVVSKDQHESGTGGALPRPPPVCNGEPHVSKSESSCGCSLVEDQVSVEASKKSRLKIIEVDGINDSCSSSKSNMELVSVSTKTEGHDNGECSSSTVMAAEFAGEDQSEKHRCISTLGKQRVFEGIFPGKTRASSKRIVDGSGSSSSRSCKKCFLKESPEKMLLCDSCEDSFHVSCCNPHVKRIPIDEWLCSSCLKKKRIIPKERISRKTLNIISDMGRCRDAPSTSESNPVALMLTDTEPYTGGVRVGKGFQVEVPDWSGPIINDVDTIGKPVVLDPSYFVSLYELKSNKPLKFGSIGNWLQCRQVIDDAAEGGNVTICGKWRRAPLFEVQTDDWECFCCVFWDPIHADCATSQVNWECCLQN
ncbi:REMODELING AND SPACING FACTOR 1 [Salix viminalis]|uniref:REMODELING AND SPACING FACTOR 1 n=1 Tax=Salix viminalis TaxID=40686 RepID=A0A9Q0NNP5_SALVM|nr:REMODELING AND SPACING FACTOR 1 [Salix viminalis]